MSASRARDLLSDRLLDVQAESRLASVLPLVKEKRATHVAVWDKDEFQGVAQLQAAVFRHPARIFMDTLPKNKPPEILDSMELPAIAHVFTMLPADELCVFDQSGLFRGIVTREGLYAVLAGQDRPAGASYTESANVPGPPALESYAREKVLLVHEMHHRVKNNIQIMISLLNLQNRFSEDHVFRASLQSCVDRMRSIAMVHEKLYQSESYSEVDLSGFVELIVRRLMAAHNSVNVRPLIECGEVRVPLDRAVPCGIILNELVSNSLRHAFPDGREGRLEVRLAAHPPEKRFVVEVFDDGVGLPAGLDMDNPTTAGFVIVRSLARQIKGDLRRENGNGVRFTLSFPAGLRPVPFVSYCGGRPGL